MVTPALSTWLGWADVQVYERLQVVAANIPVADQQDGSYMTAFSLPGFQ